MEALKTLAAIFAQATPATTPKLVYSPKVKQTREKALYEHYLQHEANTQVRVPEIFEGASTPSPRIPLIVRT